jgi:hypothetical protein
MAFQRLVLGALVAASVALVGCVTHHYDRDYDEPRHGYRYRYDGRDLMYDSHIGVYYVPGYSHHYFHDGWYYRYAGDRWYRCRSLRGQWAPVHYYYVPQRLIVYRYPRSRYYVYDPREYDRHRGDKDWKHSDVDHYERSDIRVPNSPDDGKRIEVPGRDLTYEKDAKAYKVEDTHGDTYYKDGKFYRRTDEGWEKSTHKSRGYDDVNPRSVPEDIRTYEREQEQRQAERRREAQREQEQQLIRQQQMQHQSQPPAQQQREERRDKRDRRKDKDEQKQEDGLQHVR